MKCSNEILNVYSKLITGRSSISATYALAIADFFHAVIPLVTQMENNNEKLLMQVIDEIDKIQKNRPYAEDEYDSDAFTIIRTMLNCVICGLCN